MVNANVDGSLKPKIDPVTREIPDSEILSTTKHILTELMPR